MALQQSIFSVVRKSIGNVTYRVGKTAQNKSVSIASQKVVKQTNPKTQSQMEQRARFATSVKFYKRATKNFFKFAFEDQKGNESDYNAFMRHNTSAAARMNRYQVLSESYPALGNPWLLSQGFLIPLSISYDVTSKQFTIGVSASTGTNISTVADISALFKARGYQVGDIVTVVYIETHMSASSIGVQTSDDVASEAASLASTPTWNIGQFIISDSDTRTLAELPYVGSYSLDKLLVVSSANGGGLAIPDADNTKGNLAAVIVTRRNGRKLFASTSYLVGNTVYHSMLSTSALDSYLAAMLTSWGASADDAILKGYLSGAEEEQTEYPAITSVDGSSVPVTLSRTTSSGDVSLTIEGRNFGSEREVTENSFHFSTDSATVKSCSVSSTSALTLVVTLPVNFAGTLYFDGGQTSNVAIVTWEGDDTDA